MRLTEKDLQALLLEGKQQFEAAKNGAQLEELYKKLLGKKSEIVSCRQQLAHEAAPERKRLGMIIQEIQQALEFSYQQVKSRLATHAEVKSSLMIDVTAYEPYLSQGSLHPYTVLIERIEDIFLALGWSRAEGPEVEDEFHNFNALNIPPHHPARDDHDTFWLSHPSALLRTHTSSVEIRYLQREALPCAIFAPGRVFRHEATDATHDFAFMQCEGLLVDKHVSLAHLRAILTLFMQQLFDNNQLALRVRPSYFPFVEPGLEVDVTCPFCTGGCSICKRTGWIELGGAGLTHPAVLKACGIDSQQWTGCAFGFGIERLGQLFYRIPDVRLFKTGKIRFLEQIASIPTH